jgi:uncharacterized protein
MISEETLRAFYRSVADHLGDEECFEFVWHGGEPLLLGKKRFRRYIALQKEYLRPSQIINVVQTNATIIDDEWCDLLQELDVGVGVSLDGPQDVHDRRRPGVRGRSSYRNTLRGIKLMQNRGNKVGALCVADPAASGRRVLSHFCELGLPDCDLLIPITNNSLESLAGARTDHADADGLRRYYLDAFDEWITNRKEVISVRLFDSLIQNAFGIPHGDLNAGSRNIAENVIVETDGTVCLDPDFWYVDRFALGEVYSLNYNARAWQERRTAIQFEGQRLHPGDLGAVQAVRAAKARVDERGSWVGWASQQERDNEALRNGS